MSDVDALLLQLGKQIRRYREARGWSQEELARRCERHFTYIGRVERGQQNLTVEVLHEIAAALGVAIADILIEDQPPLLADWKVTAMDVMQALSHGFRARADVKGKLAEWMLFKDLNRLQKSGSVQHVEWQDKDDRPDFVVTVAGREVVVECKNVRSLTGNERPDVPIRVELQKTRNARDGSNTRGYRTNHFDVLSACLFNRLGKWDFLHVSIMHLATRPDDPKCLKVMHVIPAKPEPPWRASILEAIQDGSR